MALRVSCGVRTGSECTSAAGSRGGFLGVDWRSANDGCVCLTGRQSRVVVQQRPLVEEVRGRVFALLLPTHCSTGGNVAACRQRVPDCGQVAFVIVQPAQLFRWLSVVSRSATSLTPRQPSEVFVCGEQQQSPTCRSFSTITRTHGSEGVRVVVCLRNCHGRPPSAKTYKGKKEGGLLQPPPVVSASRSEVRDLVIHVGCAATCPAPPPNSSVRGRQPENSA